MVGPARVFHALIGHLSPADYAVMHGATLDKYVGDAIIAFFGDPETRGVAEDAKACVAMAVEMQQRIAELTANGRLMVLGVPSACVWESIPASAQSATSAVKTEWITP